MEPTESAKALFLELAKASFSFLLDRGFYVTEEVEATSLRYASPNVFVGIYRDRYSYHVDFTVGTLDHPKDRLMDFEIMKLAGALAQRSLQPLTAEQMKIDLAELARRLDVYGGRALEGDPAIF